MPFEGWFPASDPNLPDFASIVCLYLAVLVSSFIITADFFGARGKKKIRVLDSMADTKAIAMIGCGSMGGGMSLLFAEEGIQVGLSDPNEDLVDLLVDKAEKAGYHGLLKKFKDYGSLTKFLSSPRVLVFSLPHGTIGDKVLESLLPHLSQGDIILDCGNEHFQNTERRQAKCREPGIHYLGVGVSGGYQAARAGPSMCPGGDEEGLRIAMPLLEKVAAKDPEGKPCVGRIGNGGAGHYVKMLHNGIEHGMMSAISEAWEIMRRLGMGYEEIGDELRKWNDKGELQGTFLIDIGADLSHKHDEHKQLVISEVLDKVVQDITGEEGTGIWSNTEAIEQHVPALTLNVAHALRLASAYRDERVQANKTSNGGFPAQKFKVEDKVAFLEDLRKATYAACLASYIQGLNVILRADKAHKWNINYSNVWQIWKAGCIIRADYISSQILGPRLTSGNCEDVNLLKDERTFRDIRNCYPSLRRIVAKGVETDQVIPALGASLEYFKIVTGTDLPTSFYEAELDYFGSHMFDKKGEKDVGGPTEGKHHFEWKPAVSRKQEYKGKL